jgi:exodeoxyribonuclease VII large subunit
MRVFTVSQVTAYIGELLASDLALADVWIAGEVSGPRTQPSGHSYFTLKDAGAQLRCVMFRSSQVRPQARGMNGHLVQGAQVIAHGRLSFYEARGDIQVVVDWLRPEGVGLRQAQLDLLMAKLEEEGLFDPSRKRPLPVFPRRVGVVTSPAGAVFHDICDVLGRRWPLAEVVLAPAPVQGPNAVAGIVGGIETLNGLGDIDVIIVARGGGSIEELWAFNEEPVARAVFGSLVPVVSAVGHETDTTVCDHVADLRAPTPSAAAERVSPDRIDVALRIGHTLATGLASVRGDLTRAQHGLAVARGRAERALPDLPRLRQRVDDFDRRALSATTAAYERRRHALAGRVSSLTSLDPQAVLERGYAVVHKDGGVVSSIGQVSTGDGIVVKLADGGFPARVQTPGQRRRVKTTPVTRNGDKPARERSVQPTLFP